MATVLDRRLDTLAYLVGLAAPQVEEVAAVHRDQILKARRSLYYSLPLLEELRNEPHDLGYLANLERRLRATLDG